MNPLSSSRRAAPLVLTTIAFLICSWPPAPGARKDRDDPGKGDDTDSATLVISTVLVPGHGKTTVEFRRGDTVVRSTVHNYHNVPTKHRSIRGTFYPVYLVMTGKTHREPGAFQTVQSILKALKPEGIAIAEDKTMTKKNPDDDSEPRVRILKLRYVAGIQKP